MSPTTKRRASTAPWDTETRVIRRRSRLTLSDLPALPPGETQYVPDCLAPNLDVLFIGFNPGVQSAYHRHHYAGSTNHFWPLLSECGLVPVEDAPLTFQDDVHCPSKYRLGFTNIVDRPTTGTEFLTAEDYRQGRQRIHELLQQYRPKVACFVGYGVYQQFVGGSRAARNQRSGRVSTSVPGPTEYFVLASTSPRPNISRQEKLKQFQELCQLVSDLQ